MSELKALLVRDVRCNISKRPAMVRESADVATIIDTMLKDPHTRSVYTVDPHQRLTGIITVSMLAKNAFRTAIPHPLWNLKRVELYMEQVAGTIKERPVAVRDDDTLERAFQTMFKHSYEELPVVDEQERVIGTLDLLELLTTVLSQQ